MSDGNMPLVGYHQSPIIGYHRAPLSQKFGLPNGHAADTSAESYYPLDGCRYIRNFCIDNCNETAN